jgi:hypothetical protein
VKARRDAILKVLVPETDKVLAAFPDDGQTAASLVFVDPRDTGSMLLTKLGFEMLKEAKFDFWSQEITTTMTFANHTYLVAVSTFPYYVNERILTTFDSNLGVLMKMVSGDFGQLERLLPRN